MTLFNWFYKFMELISGMPESERTLPHQCKGCPNKDNIKIYKDTSFGVKDVGKLLACCKVKGQLEAARRIKIER